MRLGNVPLGHQVCSNTVTVLPNTKLLNYAFNLQSPEMEEHQTVGHFFHYSQFFSRLRHLCYSVLSCTWTRCVLAIRAKSSNDFRKTNKQTNNIEGPAERRKSTP